MHVLPLQPDDVEQQPLGEPVLAHDAGRHLAALAVSSRWRSPATVSRPSRSIRATVWLTVGPACPSRSAIRARSGTMPSSSSSKMVRRYISVVSIRSVTCQRLSHSPRPRPRSRIAARRAAPRRSGLRHACRPCSGSAATCGCRPPGAARGATRRTAAGSLPLFVLDPALWGRPAPPRRAWLAALAARPGRAPSDGALVVRTATRAGRCPRLAARGRRGRPVHVSADAGPYGRAPRRRRRAALAGDGGALVATGSPYAVGPGPVRKARRARPTRSSPRSPAPGARTAGRRPAPRRAALRLGAARRRPQRGAARRTATPAACDLPTAGEAAALRRWQAFRGRRARRLRDRRDRPGAGRDVGAVAAPEVRRDPPAHAARRPRRRTRARRRALPRRSWPGASSTPTCSGTTPSAPWHDLRAELRPDAATTSRRRRASRPGSEGRTGYPIVDAGMRQLLAEGWMHNRVRMIVASFLVKDLHVWWPLGARHFLRLPARRRPREQQPRLAVGGRHGHRRGAVLPRLQPGDAGPEVRPGRRLRPALGARAARTWPGGAAHEPWEPPTATPTATRSGSSTTREEREALRRYGDCAADRRSGPRSAPGRWPPDEGDGPDSSCPRRFRGPPPGNGGWTSGRSELLAPPGGGPGEGPAAAPPPLEVPTIESTAPTPRPRAVSATAATRWPRTGAGTGPRRRPRSRRPCPRGRGGGR